MSLQPFVTLNDTRSIPQLGLGVWRTPQGSTSETVQAAIASSYRHIDTAAMYGNEKGVGDGIRASGVDRESVFVTTKLWTSDQGFDLALRAFDTSLQQFGLPYIDLYPIHWPSPSQGLYVDTWRAFVRLKQEGRVRSIGVSNFAIDQLDRIIGETGVAPVLNQIELHPRCQQRALRQAHSERGIATESLGPLGQGRLVNDPVIKVLAAKDHRSTAQIIIRWHLDNGLIVIPKSSKLSRIAENFDVFSFQLEADDLATLAGLDAT